MKSSIKSRLRGMVNFVRRNLIKDKKTQKLITVRLNNLNVLFHGNKKPIQTTFDYKAIMAGPKIFYWDEPYHGNVHFGIANAIKEYAGIKGSLNCCIEHGVYFGNHYFPDEAVDSGFTKLVTFGRQRVEHLKKVANVDIIPIGPYIHYAEPSLSEDEIKKVKKKNGKTLLVFPTHSIDRVDKEFDYEQFIENIDIFKKEHEFQTILICLFYKDLMLGRDKIYYDHGYQVVTAGYRDDPMFLRRLKSFILLSDYTISNDMGTHVGYCIYLGKAHTVFEQTIRIKPYLDSDLENETKTYNPTVEYEKEEVKREFRTYYDEITARQKDIVNRFWGIEFIRSKAELAELLK